MKRPSNLVLSLPVVVIAFMITDISFIHGFPVHTRRRSYTSWTISTHTAELHDEPENKSSELSRRSLLSWGIVGSSAAASASLPSYPASAAPTKASSLFLVTTKNTTSVAGLQNEEVNVDTAALSSEICLLKLLPVQNKVFRQLEVYVTAMSSLRGAPEGSGAVWKDVNKKMQSALSLLDSKRSLLQPEFNQDDSAVLQIAKGERGERCIEALRTEIVKLIDAIKQQNADEVFAHQKRALLALSDIGELLVESFPYDVPTEGKFSYLPRLLGRARVTFGFKRQNEFLGNITIIADGFAAPITAGNFVDLSLRQFYSGLAIKSVKKRFGGVASTQSVLDDLLAFDLIEEKLGIDDSGPDTVSLPILGSFNEGFYDPLTGKPRRIPLEILSVDTAAGTPRLSYSEGFTDLSSEASLQPSTNIQPLLGFDIPGLVSWNHPDKNVNVGSSEFFSLQYKKMRPSKRKLFDGRYAPFGYIIDGYDVYQDLRPGDVIDATTVGDWGQLNLVKIRGASFSDVMQSDEG